MQAKDHLIIPHTPIRYRPHHRHDDDYSISNTTHDAPRDQLHPKTILGHPHYHFDIRPSPLLEGLVPYHLNKRDHSHHADPGDDNYQEHTHD